MSPQPKTPPRRYAVIDIGTNSIKLVVASVDRDRVKPHYFARIPTRLGQGLAATNRISTAAARRTADAVATLAADARAHGAEDVTAVGTYAFRAARNGRDVSRLIGRRAGVKVGILSGVKEASFVLDAVRARIPRLRPNVMAVDIGGGSAQLIVARGKRTVLVRSVPLGAVVLTEQSLHGDPIDYFEYILMRHRIDRTISSLFAQLPRFAPGTVDLVVSGGAATTAAAMTGVRSGQSHCSLRISQLVALQMRLVESTIAQRRRLPGMQPDRADIMPAGVAVLLSFARHARKRSVKIAEGGWRDGVILELAQRAGRSRRKTRTTARGSAAARKGR